MNNLKKTIYKILLEKAKKYWDNERCEWVNGDNVWSEGGYATDIIPEDFSFVEDDVENLIKDYIANDLIEELYGESEKDKREFLEDRRVWAEADEDIDDLLKEELYFARDDLYNMCLKIEKEQRLNKNWI